MATVVPGFYTNKTLSESVLWETNETLRLSYRVDGEGNASYRKVVYLAFPIDELADRISLKNCLSKFTFSPINFTIRQANSSYLEKPWVDSGGKVQVSLKRPWRIARVNSQRYGQAELFRVDGDAVSEEATVSGAVGSHLPRDFFAKDFAVKLSGSPNSASLVTQQQSKTERLSDNAVGLTPGFFKADKSSGGSGGNQPLGASASVHKLTSLWVNSLPSTPRYGFLNEETDSVDVVGIEGGEHFDDVALQTHNDFTTQLETRLEQAINNGQVVNGKVLIPIALASDTPCDVKLTQFDVRYVLQRTRFDNGEGKYVGEFAGGATETRVLPLDLKGLSLKGMAAEKLRLTVIRSNTGSLSNIVGALQTTNQLQGLALNQWLVSRFVPAKAQWVSGIGAYIQGLSPEVKIACELRGISNDLPAELIGKTDLTSKALGQRTLLNGSFTQPQLLESKPYFMLFKVQSGNATLLSQIKTEVTSASENNSPVQRMSRDSKGQFKRLNQLKDIELLYEILAPDFDSDKAFTLKVGDTTVQTEKVEQQYQYEVTGQNILDEDLSIRSSEKGKASVEDILLEYSV